jgi:hypothetical protein
LKKSANSLARKMKMARATRITTGTESSRPQLRRGLEKAHATDHRPGEAVSGASFRVPPARTWEVLGMWLDALLGH